jgi:hypothetical protein
VKDHKVLAPEAPAEVAAQRLSAPLLETLLELLHGWAPAFRQRRTWARALALALGLFCGWGRRSWMASRATRALGSALCGRRRLMPAFLLLIFRSLSYRSDLSEFWALPHFA